MTMGMNGGIQTQDHRGFKFAGFTLDIDRAALLKDGVDQNLRPQVFDVLRYLVERESLLVSKEELLEGIWGDKAVTDDSLTHCIIEIRKALDDADREIIRTVPRRGFVFDIPVERLATVAPEKMRRRRSDRLRPLAAVAALIALAVFVVVPLTENEGSGTDDVPSADEPDYYAQAQFLFQRRSPGDLDAALGYFQKAIELDPHSSQAWAGVAGVYRILSFESDDNDADLQQLKVAAEKAIALDSQNGEGWARLAQYYSETGDIQASARAFETAKTVAPNDQLVLKFSAGRMADRGDLSGAIEILRRVLVAEPLSFVDRGNLSIYLLAAGQYEEAISESQRAYQMRPPSADDLNSVEGFALIKLGRYDEALAVVEEWPEGPDRFAALAMTYYSLDRADEVATAVESLSSSSDNDSLIRLAEFEAYTGQMARSFTLLTRVRGDIVATGSPKNVKHWIYGLNRSPFLSVVRDDPRWQDWVDQTHELVLAANAPPAPD